MSDITIKHSQILEAAEILGCRDNYEDVSIELIAKVFSSHLEELIEEMLEYPEHFFNSDYQLWKKIDAQAVEAETEAA